MKLSSLTLSTMDIPFRVTFKHSSATRDRTCSVWVTAKSDKATGFGEACPREYVTGEDMSSVAQFFQQHHDEVMQTIHDLGSLKHWVSENETTINQHPAAWCAIELALLDLLSNENGLTIEHLLDFPDLQGEFVYTAVLGDSSINAFSQQLQQYVSLGMRDFKIKVTNDEDKNLDKIKLIRSYVPNARIRLDANNLWESSKQAIAQLRLCAENIIAVEEPLRVGDYQGMAEIASTFDVKIILDESFTQKQHYQALLSHPQHWILNLRVSKLGGLLRSLECAIMAKEYGIPCIVGAQVGETSLLTRAGLTVAQACKNNLVAQEGAFGLYLLEKDICEAPIMFGQGGKVVASQISGIGQPGFGLHIQKDL